MQKDLLKLLDLSKEDIIKILNTADQLKYNQKHHIPHDYLRGKTLASRWRTPPGCWTATATAS